MYFHYFVIISPWKRTGSSIWTKLNPLHPRMLCAKFSWNSLSGSGEEAFLMVLRWRRKTFIILTNTIIESYIYRKNEKFILLLKIELGTMIISVLPWLPVDQNKNLSNCNHVKKRQTSIFHVLGLPLNWMIYTVCYPIIVFLFYHLTKLDI